jgi:hypothetical protein
MPGQKLIGAHRMSYEVMKSQIDSSVGKDGKQKYIVNNQKMAKQKGLLNIRAAQSFLWSQVQLVPGSSSYLFQVKDGVPNAGNNNILPMERRLKDQDVFFTYALAFYLLCTSTGSSNGSFQFELMTFPSANFFGALPFGVNSDRLVGIWTSGVLSIKINGEILTPVWDMGQHLMIPETQVLAAPGPSSTAPLFDQKDLSEDGFVVVEPNWIINGGNNNEYIVNYPSNFAEINVPDPTVYNWKFFLVMKWQGFLAQNVSSIMDNNE